MGREQTPDLRSDPDRRAVQQFLAATRAQGCARLSEGASDARVELAAIVDSTIVGYAQATATGDRYIVDCVADDVSVRAQLVESLIGQLPPGADVTWWGHDDASDLELAKQLHMHATPRRLLNMRRPLPLEDELMPAADLVLVRPFISDHDDEAWLKVNNAAFSWHGEQGDWDLATLRSRMNEPWFDPAGFLLHERDGCLAAFCWTKVHPDAVGEIYVIAVHPHFHGLGLGRALTIAGLRHLAHTGSTTAMLYVEADNTAAVRLYESLGFGTTHTDVAFHRLTGDI